MIDYNIFTLGRTIDRKYLPNQLIISITIFSFIFASLIQFFIINNILEAIFLGIILSIITFLSWALNRELYPQEEYAALAGVILFIITLPWYDVFPLIILFLIWFIIILRLINQTTGLKPSIFDRFLILLFTVINSYFFSWIFLVFMVIIFLLNYKFTKEKYDLFFILIGIILSPVLIYFQNIFYNQDSLIILSGLLIFLLLTIFVILMWLDSDINVVGDYSNKKVPFNRIFSAQIISVFLIFGYILWFGDKSILLLLPVWCLFFCSVIFSFFNFCIKIKKGKYKKI
jgi:hypothetical protein